MSEKPHAVRGGYPSSKEPKRASRTVLVEANPEHRSTHIPPTLELTHLDSDRIADIALIPGIRRVPRSLGMAASDLNVDRRLDLAAFLLVAGSPLLRIHPGILPDGGHSLRCIRLGVAVCMDCIHPHLGSC